jgi:hypothetical protein
MHIEFTLPLKLILTKNLKILVFTYTIDFYSQIYCSICYKSHIATHVYKRGQTLHYNMIL